MLDNVQTLVDNMQKFYNDIIDKFFEAEWKRLQPLQSETINKVKKGFVRNMLPRVMEAYNSKLSQRNKSPDQMDSIVSINKFTEYIYYYHLFFTSHLDDDERARLQKSSDYQKELINKISASVICNEHGQMNVRSFTAAVSPEVLGYCILSNCLLEYLVIIDRPSIKADILRGLFQTAFITIKAMLNLIGASYNINAITLWRQLHEIECVIITLNHAESEVSEKYYNYQEFYNLEYGDNSELKEKLDKEKSLYKDKIETMNYKEKLDFERSFVNYGWLLAIKDFRDEWNHGKCRLDFRNGLQKFAQQSERFQAYREASKIIHPSAKILVLAQQDYYFFLIEQISKRLYITLRENLFTL
ncbi:hypothetical protein FACS1894211_12330 [Clostridia bacterium]|nr:hypothetical protein FACS1894211_12330 [Clostridia bacterium]